MGAWSALLVVNVGFVVTAQQYVATGSRVAAYANVVMLWVRRGHQQGLCLIADMSPHPPAAVRCGLLYRLRGECSALPLAPSLDLKLTCSPSTAPLLLVSSRVLDVFGSRQGHDDLGE